MLVEPGNQFSLTRAALSTGGRAKSNFLLVGKTCLLTPSGKPASMGLQRMRAKSNCASPAQRQAGAKSKFYQ